MNNDSPEDHRVDEQTETDSNAETDATQHEPSPGYTRVEPDVPEDSPKDDDDARKLAALWLEAWEGDRKQSPQAVSLFSQLKVQNSKAAERSIDRAKSMVRDQYPEFSVSDLLPPNHTGSRTGDEELDRELGLSDGSAEEGQQLGVDAAESRSSGSEQTQPNVPSRTDTRRQSEQSADGSALDEDELTRPSGVTPEADAELPPETKTAREAGIVDDDGTPEWLSDASKTEVTETKRYDLPTYKGTDFAVYEPEDQQRYENHLNIIEGVDRESSDRRKQKADRFARELAEDLLVVLDDDGDETPVMDVYHYEAADGTGYEVHDPDGVKGVASHPDTEPLWEAMSWFDRNVLGRQIGETISGEKGFRSRRP